CYRARVRAPLRAAAERLALVRERAARCAWRESAVCEAERVGCFFSARVAAAERRADVRRGAAMRPFDALRRGEDRFVVEVDLRLDVERVARVDFAFDLAFDFAGDLRDFAAAFFGRAALAPFFGFTSTPARRASDSPIAIACLAFFAPCLPARMRSIS